MTIISEKALDKLRAGYDANFSFNFKVVHLFSECVIGVQRLSGSDVHYALWTRGRSLIARLCIGCGSNIFNEEVFLPLQSAPYRDDRYSIPCMDRETALFGA